MDFWKQQAKGRQQQHLSHKTPTAGVKSDQNLSSAKVQQQLPSDPNQAIANVLNQHHSRFVQNKKKNQQKQEEQKQVKQTVKLDQSPKHHPITTTNNNNNLAQPQQVSQRSSNKASSASHDSSSSSASANCSHKSTTAAANNNNQVDQGNSYLYAYNDFVTSTSVKKKATLNKELELACVKQQKQDVFVTSNNEVHEGLRSSNRAPVLQLHQQQEEREFQINQADCLLESDEDDALSYILHQHRSPQQELLHNIQHSIETANQPCRYQQGAKQTYLQAYDEDFEAHRIDHHLSCSRSSHPRHICGIGGGQNDNLNHIAARLREESQRAFALNQRSSTNQNATLHNHHHHHHNLNSDHDIQLINNDIAAIQSHQFTHDLTVLHNQLANGHSSVSATGPTDNQYHHHHHHQLNFHTTSGGSDNDAYLTTSDDLHTAGGGREHENLTFDRKQLLLDSTGSVQHMPTAAANNYDGGQGSSSRLVVNDTSDLSSSSGGCNDQTTSLTQEVLQPAHGPATGARQINSGYFNWLLCSFGNFLGAPIKQQHQQSQLQRFAHDYATNVRSSRHQNQNQQQQLSSGRREAYEPSSSVVSMYNTSQQSGQLGGQPGAYYATQTSQAEVAGMQTAYSQHAHHLHHHQHHYPLSSDSSLGSSGPFASSALRLNNFFRQCCSKKCFFVSCLILILLIFIVVIGLTAYLNFLINLNKTNLTPLSGRLRVDNQADQYNDQLANRTSKEFLAKQQQYETILRGAFDRTQNFLKSYPNHLVKCEVYAFKPGSLWVYFRLYINKRTLLQDNQLMKRKSPEEHVDKHFLPRLTQQTLHSGFEQLVSTFNRGSAAALSTGNSDMRRSRSSQTAELRQPRTPEARSSFSSTSSPITSASSHRDHVKSFDDQISRLMPIIESIDLQTILVTPDFDMLQLNSAAKSFPEQPPSMSDGLLASQPLTTTPSTLLVATGPSKYLTEYDIGQSTSSTIDGQAKAAILSSPTPKPPPLSTASESGSTNAVTESSDGVSVVTRKFTITGYKENTTRPVTSSRPTLQQTNSLFLVNQTQRKPPPPLAKNDESTTQASVVRPSNTLREIGAATGAHDSPFSTSDSMNKEVVGLKSGKPLVSQNSNNNNQRTPSRNTEDSKLASTASPRNTSTIFAPLHQLDKIQNGYSNSNASLPLEIFSPDRATADKLRNVGRQRDKMTNEKTAVMQMVAPYQKIEASTVRAHEVLHGEVPNVTKVLDSAIQDLWNTAIGNKKNGTNRQVVQVDLEHQPPKRLITVTTIGANNQDNSPDPLDWNKISILPLEITNTIRTQINQTQPMQSTFTTTSTSTTTTTPVTSSQSLPNRVQKPKVSPLVNQGGSIISTAASRQQNSNSAIVLSKDLMQPNNLNTISNNNVEAQLLGAATNTTQQQVPPRPSPTRAEKLQQKQVGGQSINTTSTTTITTTTAATTHAHVHAPAATFTPVAVANNEQPKRKVSVKLPKVKKVSSASTETKNGTQISSQPINSKGIRIVDDFLATIESSQPNRTAQVVFNQNIRQQQQHKNKTLEPFNYNVDQLMPTTIDLIRSVTTSSLPTSTRTSSLHSIDTTSSVGSATVASSNADYTSTLPSTQKLTTPMTSMTEIKLVSPISGSSSVSSSPLPSSFVTSSPFANSRLLTERQQSSNYASKPTPTTNFSNQWKPITNSTSDLNNNSSSVSDGRPTPSRKPNVSFIVGSEKLSSSLVNVPSSQGSQSPFAMSPSILESQLRPSGQRASGRLSRPQQVTNSYQAASNSIPNEFESHRVSRMRQGESSSSNVADTFGTVETSSTTAGLFSEPKTRYVDDFMITTDKVEPEVRSTTILPPLTVSSSSTTTTRLDRLVKVRTLNPLDQVPKRTRGPFAFETLKSVSGSGSADNNKLQSDMSGVFPGRSERSTSRLAGGLVETVMAAADNKLLVRKKLFLGNGDDDELSASSTSNPSAPLVGEGDISKIRPTSTASSSVINATDPTKSSLTYQGVHASDDYDDYGNRKFNSNGTTTRQQQFLTDNGNMSFRCQYYGCKAKGSLRYTCLNYTQVCDDFIDCQDESDELDCVSLLKHDSKSNKLSFSNGGGIIYLNRKGSLAPMCIDYYTSGAENRLTRGSPADSPINEQDLSQSELTKKQQELIKQINTIGQYACSLQSFSRLVSVKINHHDLVDSLNLIKTSKLYHRLSIIDSSEDTRDESLYGTYKSGSAKHEVELTTSPNCPSQRTVFVKCGSFDCGQYSFTVMDKNNNAAKGKDGVIINDFPWLVKLYWMGALSCHGYLIDELWLISSSECIANRTTPTSEDSSGWTAEISYEHYGNDDYQTIESNRRNIQDILVQPVRDGNNTVAPSIVLAKLEKPVRFSPLNRPICLPLSAINKTSDVERTYKDCVTAILPMAATSPTSDILLSKVKVSNPKDCLLEVNLNNTKSLDNLICVSEQKPRNDVQLKEVNSTRVLICSTTARSRLKWTIVGVQNRVQDLRLASNKHLFTTVLGQLDWIVDTMNPKSDPNLKPEGNNLNGNELNPMSTVFSSQNQTCNRFKCSSGECLAWSRICDGLYDCSSHEDEKDCHK